MKIFDEEYLQSLNNEALIDPRGRRNRNIHESFDDPCQCFFNAITLESYIRPHRHLSEEKHELFLACSGVMGLITFYNSGEIKDILCFGVGGFNSVRAIGAEVDCATWHTIVALEPSSILLEVKAGPFDPKHSKDFADWAPSEGSLEAVEYLKFLQHCCL